MKYIFILNNHAGNKSAEKENEFLEQYKDKVEYALHLTLGKKEATTFIKNYCKENPEEETCFVACGGDGTVNEVISGLVGEKNKYFAVLSYGSGNDFIKCFPNKDFLSLDKLFAGEKTQIDVMQVNDSYSVNVINVGFDAKVGSVANKVKDKGGKNPYGRGVFTAIFTAMKNKIDVYADGEKVGGEKMLMANFSNGKYCGGKYLCAPLSVMDDGLMEFSYFKPVSLFKFLKILKPYERGEHINHPALNGILTYKRTADIKVVSQKEIELSLDGEMLSGTEFNIKCLHKALNFIVPAD